MLKFNTTLENMINAQANRRTNYKQFMDYSSKKKLLESGLLDESLTKYIRDLKNAFAFSVHKDLRYMVIHMYDSANKTYKFFVLDTKTLQVAEAESVKIAKKEIMELLAANK